MATELIPDGMSLRHRASSPSHAKLALPWLVSHCANKAVFKVRMDDLSLMFTVSSSCW